MVPVTGCYGVCYWLLGCLLLVTMVPLTGYYGASYWLLWCLWPFTVDPLFSCTLQSPWAECIRRMSSSDQVSCIAIPLTPPPPSAITRLLWSFASIRASRPHGGDVCGPWAQISLYTHGAGLVQSSFSLLDGIWKFKLYERKLIVLKNQQQ